MEGVDKVTPPMVGEVTHLVVNGLGARRVQRMKSDAYTAGEKWEVDKFASRNLFGSMAKTYTRNKRQRTATLKGALHFWVRLFLFRLMPSPY